MQHSNGLLNGKPSGKRSFRTHSRLCAIERGLPKLLLTAQSPSPVISTDLKQNNLIGIALNVSRSRWTLSPPSMSLPQGSVPKGHPSTWPNSIIMSRGTQLNCRHLYLSIPVDGVLFRHDHYVWTTTYGRLSSTSQPEWYMKQTQSYATSN